ncbi:MAG: citrate synthase [Puniceicoccaceae bacterium]
MTDVAKVTLDQREFEFPIIRGTENEVAFDLRKLRATTGAITYDEGYGNTGSCQSKITYINGEKGILRHRGYPIEVLAKKSGFLETAFLVIYGELPTVDQMAAFRARISRNSFVHEQMRNHYDGFPTHSHPMAILSAMLNSLGCYYPDMTTNRREIDLEHFDQSVALLISKVRTLAAMAFRMKQGQPFIYPRKDLRYCENFMHMMFSDPYHRYDDAYGLADAIDLFLLLHADHEQNCSTSTVRMVASGGANLFASVSAGVSALWGPFHGGANAAVVEMLEAIHRDGDDGSRFIKEAKEGKQRLMGFGHRVYKNYDPRAKILGEVAEQIFAKMDSPDPLLRIARRLEESALNDSYFKDRNLYPNVDFYSGLILKAAGIPTEFFTVMFAIGRMPGWIANWLEIASDPQSRIHRPRQIYQGHLEREFVPLENR